MEENKNTSIENEGTVNESAETETQPTMESLMDKIAELTAQNQKLSADFAKQKNRLDGVNSEAADWKRKYRETLSTQQQAEEAKAEEVAKEAERVKGLEEFKAKTLATQRYMNIEGMDFEMAEKAAAAEISGDMDLLSSIRKEFNDSLRKNIENEIYAKVGNVNFSTGDDAGAYANLTKSQILAIKDRYERREAIASRPDIFI